MLKRIILYLGVLMRTCTLLSTDLPNREMIILLETINYETLTKTLEAPNVYEYRTILHPLGIGATTVSMLIALYQQAAPIIANKSLIKNVIDHRNFFLDFVQLDRKTLYKKYGTYNRFRGRSTLDIFKRNCQRTYELTNEVNKMLQALLKNSEEDLDSILKKILCHPPFQGSSMMDIRNAMSNSSYIKSLNLEMRMLLLCSWIDLLNDWHIKQVNDDIFLLLPKAYLQKIKIDEKLFQKRKLSVSQLTDLELALGLKVDHMTPVSSHFFEKSGPVANGIPFAKSLEQIFITHDDLTKISFAKPANLKWSFYLSGHGLSKHPQLEVLPQLYNLEDFYKKRIAATPSKKFLPLLNGHNSERHQAEYFPKLRKLKYEIQKAEVLKQNVNKVDHGMINSLSIDEFREVLKFLNNNIETAFLYYSSCYSAGPHLIEPYEENGKPLIFNYSIMTGTPAENMSLQEFPFINIPPYFTEKDGALFEPMDATHVNRVTKNLALTTPLHFENFFALLRKGVHKTTQNLILLPYSLHPHVDQFKQSIPQRIANIPLIRLAHSNHFKVTPHDDSSVILDAHNKTHDVIIDKNISLIFNDYKPGKLTLDKLGRDQQIPKFISMIPGFALHTFEEINSTTLNLHEIINSFLTFTDLGSSKIFWIKKLKCLPNSTRKAAPETLKDVIIMRNVFNSDTLAECSTEDPMRFKSWAYFSTDSLKETKLLWDGPCLENNNYKINSCKQSEHKEECLHSFPQARAYVNPVLQSI